MTLLYSLSKRHLSVGIILFIGVLRLLGCREKAAISDPLNVVTKP